MFEIEMGPVSINCQACGLEYFETDLKTVKVAGFSYPITICKSCLSKTAEDNFISAAELLNEVILIARATSENPERRLKAIKKLLGE